MPKIKSFFSTQNHTVAAFRSCIATLILLLFFSCAGFSQTLHFKKYNCRLSKNDTTTINQIAHYEAAFYNAVFDTLKNDSLSININVFGRKDDFKKTPDGENALLASGDGYFLEKTGELYVLKTDHVNGALLHEMSHAFLHQNFSKPPKWFDEGIATYFGSLIVQDNKIYFTPVTERIQRIKEMNDQGILHLEDFVQNNSRNWGDKNQITDHYTIAYGIIYFLVKTNLNLVKHLAVGLKYGQPANVVLTEMFGSMDTFQSRFINFYKQQN